MAGCNTGSRYNLYLSQRGNNSLHGFQEAVDKALSASEVKTDSEVNYKLEIVPGKEMPELSIIDYLMWAVQRLMNKDLQVQECDITMLNQN